MYKQMHSQLTVTSLTPEQHDRTFGYWYLVFERGASHIAFAERANLEQWLKDRKLELAAALPAHGEFKMIQVFGTYASAATLPDEFWALQNVIAERRQVDNGSYTLARITEDADGIRTVHVINCNYKRPVFPYHESRLMVG